MIKEIAIAASVALGTSAYANSSLPLAHEYNPSKQSGEYQATVDGVQMEMKIFGAQDVMAARLAGVNLTRSYPSHLPELQMIDIVTEKAMARYGHDQWMINKYVNEARVAYIVKMRELNRSNGLSIQ